MRRLLDVPDSTPIVNFFQEKIEDAPRDAVSVAESLSASLDRVAPGASAATKGVAMAPHKVTAVPSVAGGKRLALCVGIDKYGPPYDLSGCVNDASNWAKALRGLRFDVTMLQDEAASRAGILDALSSMVTTAEPGDVVVFQYAGHGTQVDDLDGEEEDSLDEAFCPADFADGRLLIDDDIKAVIRGLKPGVNLTCFIDCCHSGTITRAMVPGGRPGSVPAGSRARFIPYSKRLSELHRSFRATGEAAPPRTTATRGMAPAGLKEVCFSACQPHEVAYETGGNGHFTSKAMKVLSAGAALTNVQFMEQVVTAFGARPAQHPYLDCADDAKTYGLLQPVRIGQAIV
jgi:hypothetical protein